MARSLTPARGCPTWCASRSAPPASSSRPRKPGRGRRRFTATRPRSGRPRGDRRTAHRSLLFPSWPGDRPGAGSRTGETLAAGHHPGSWTRGDLGSPRGRRGRPAPACTCPPPARTARCSTSWSTAARSTPARSAPSRPPPGGSGLPPVTMRLRWTAMWLPPSSARPVEDLAGSLLSGKLTYALADLTALPRAAVVVEDRYSRLFKLPHTAGARVAEALAEAQARFRRCPSSSARPGRWPRSGPTPGSARASRNWVQPVPPRRSRTPSLRAGRCRSGPRRRRDPRLGADARHRRQRPRPDPDRPAAPLPRFGGLTAASERRRIDIGGTTWPPSPGCRRAQRMGGPSG